MTDLPTPTLFCLGFEGIRVPDDLRRLLGAGLGGVILFRRNLRDLEQICRLTAGLHAAASGPLLVGVDQEGGRVTRLPEPFLSPPPAASLGALDDAILTRDLARAVGRELRAAGFSWNLAPVLDVHTNPANPIIGDRAFSHDPERVARLGVAAIQGLTEVGLLATAKHFPGHGETAADSHLTLPESPQPTARWRAVEFVPFRRAIQAGVPVVLVAHLLCPALDREAPSSLSRTVITDILRKELGYDGVVVSDDLEMGAIAARFDVGEAAVRFLEAGGDLVLICHDAVRQRDAMAAVAAALQAGRLSEAHLAASLDRIARLHQRLGLNRMSVDGNAARAIVGAPEHRQLLQTILAATERVR
ncbi:MAG: beta-N-acetylhexosaminidase [candidate division NC10 bacterium]|nr:beta-N-acetylhexosaminidase [candidate division NC10 bacterium]MBI3087058.1 beta-N-acetylhexosaminidase [candidate division NC10 bacterium]